LRIGIDVTSAVRQGAGVGRYTRGLVRALLALDEVNRYKLVAAGPSTRATALKIFPQTANSELRVIPLSERWLDVLWYRLGVPLPVDLLVGEVDMFHSPNFVIPPLRHGRKVITVHDLSFLRVPECADPRLRDYLGDVVPRCVAEADLVLADSDNTRDDLISLLGVERERIRVVYAGVEKRFQPVISEDHLQAVRGKYDLHQPFILSLGTLEPRKNYSTLLSAYSLLRAKGEISHRLVIAGRRGWLYEQILEKAKALDRSDDVRFLGFVDDEDLPALYQLSDLFVFPSLYEGFGLPPLEAMACGVPVVASNRPCLPEVLGERAFMVNGENVEELADAMGRAIMDSDLRSVLIRYGLERAKMFQWADAAKTLLDAYQEV
jgi:glycosyltransferase involved in cell wall biosynthesis